MSDSPTTPHDVTLSVDAAITPRPTASPQPQLALEVTPPAAAAGVGGSSAGSPSPSPALGRSGSSGGSGGGKAKRAPRSTRRRRSITEIAIGTKNKLLGKAEEEEEEEEEDDLSSAKDAGASPGTPGPRRRARRGSTLRVALTVANFGQFTKMSNNLTQLMGGVSGDAPDDARNNGEGAWNEDFPWYKPMALEFADAQQERLFNAEYFVQSKGKMRATLVHLIVFILYALGMRLLSDGDSPGLSELLSTWLLGVLVLLGMLAAASSKFLTGDNYNLVIGLGLLCVCLCLGASQLLFAELPSAVGSPNTMLLTLMFTYALSTLRPGGAGRVGLASTFLYVVAFIFWKEPGAKSAFVAVLVPLFAVNACGTITCYLVELYLRRSYLSSRASEYFASLVKKEDKRIEFLLLNILPASVAQIKRSTPDKTIAEAFESVTVAFIAIENYHELTKEIADLTAFKLLDHLFSIIDVCVEECKCEKVKTIGYKYMLMAGAPDKMEEHAAAIARCCLKVCKDITAWGESTGIPVKVRAGINTGPLTAGVIGTKQFAYDCWGDAVNVAARMEYPKGEKPISEKVRVSEATYDVLKDSFKLVFNGTVEVKGKGALKGYILESENTDNYGKAQGANTVAKTAVAEASGEAEVYMNALTLTFINPWDEELYQRDSFTESLPATRLALILAIVIYSMFSLVDWILLDTANEIPWLVFVLRAVVVLAYVIHAFVLYGEASTFQRRWSSTAEPVLILIPLMLSFYIQPQITQNEHMAGSASFWVARLLFIISMCVSVFNMPLRNVVVANVALLVVMLLCWGFDWLVNEGVTSEDALLIALWQVAVGACTSRTKYAVDKSNRELWHAQKRQHSELLFSEERRQRTELLMHNILPGPIIKRMKDDPSSFMKRYEDVYIVTSDIAAFTAFSSTVDANELVHLLNCVFAGFDQAAEKRKMEKICTIGDAYLACGGLFATASADEAVAMGLDMLDVLEQANLECNTQLGLRVGMHFGWVLGGIIGQKKFQFDTWGPNCEEATRMEEQGRVATVHVTSAVFDRVDDKSKFQSEAKDEEDGSGVTHFLWRSAENKLGDTARRKLTLSNRRGRSGRRTRSNALVASQESKDEKGSSGLTRKESVSASRRTGRVGSVNGLALGADSPAP